jgi:hypothetical protein
MFQTIKLDRSISGVSAGYPLTEQPKHLFYPFLFPPILARLVPLNTLCAPGVNRNAMQKKEIVEKHGRRRRTSE